MSDTVTLTGVLTDSDGQVWANATWQADLVYSGPGRPLFKDGSLVPLSYFGSLDSSGNFSGVIGNSSEILPSNTKWRFTIASNTSARASVLEALAISGTTFDMGSYASDLVTAPRINASELVYAYNTTEILNPTQGTGYVNTITDTLYSYDGEGYVAVGVGGSGINTTLPMTGNYEAAFPVIVNGADPEAIYNVIYSGGTNADGVGSGVNVPSGVAQYQANALAGYIETLSTNCNAVALFGAALGAATGSKIWGLNVASIDLSTNPAATITGAEIDTQPQGAASDYPTDLSIIGVFSPLFAPQSGTFGTNFVSARGEVGQWTTSFRSLYGAAGLGLWLGAESATVFPSDSQAIRLDAQAVDTDPALTAFIQVIASTKNLQFTAPTGGTVYVNGTDFNVPGNNVNSKGLNASSVDPSSGGVTSGLSTNSALTTSLYAFNAYANDTTQWTAAFFSQNASSGIGMWLGRGANGANQQSQVIRLDSSDGFNTALATYLYTEATTGNLILSPAGGNVKVNGAVDATAGFAYNGSAGYTGVVATAPLTVGGTAGSMTFSGGILTEVTPAT